MREQEGRVLGFEDSSWEIGLELPVFWGAWDLGARWVFFGWGFKKFGYWKCRRYGALLRILANYEFLVLISISKSQWIAIEIMINYANYQQSSAIHFAFDWSSTLSSSQFESTVVFVRCS